MRINIDKIGKPVWVNWKQGVQLQLYPLSMTKMQEILRKATTKKISFEKGQRIETEEFDMKKYLKEVANLIANWKGIVDQNDEPVQCTDEIKFKLLDYSSKVDDDEDSMSNFVIEEAQRIGRIIEKEEEAKDENFLTSSNG